MEENDAMEGKDLALEEKKKFEERILEVIQDLKEGQTTTSVEGLEVSNNKGTYEIKLKGICFGLVSKDGKFTYSKGNVKQIKETLQEEGLTLENLGLPDMEEWIDEQEKEQEKEHEREYEREEEKEDKLEKDLSEDLEEKEEGKDKDEKENENEKQKDNKRKNLIKLNDKIFKVLIPTAKNYGGIYLDKDTGEIVGRIKNSQSREIEPLKGLSLIKGANSSKPIHGMDNGEHKHVNAYRMYQIDNRPNTGFAVLRDGTEKGNFDVKYTTRRIDSNDINDFAYIDIPLLASQTRMGEGRARDISGINRGLRGQGEQDKVQDELDELNDKIEVPKDVTEQFNKEMDKLPNGITSMKEFKEMLYEIVEERLDEERPNNDSPGVHKRQAIQIVDKMVDKNEGYEQAKYELYNERPKEVEENEQDERRRSKRKKRLLKFFPFLDGLDLDTKSNYQLW